MNEFPLPPVGPMTFWELNFNSVDSLEETKLQVVVVLLQPLLQCLCIISMRLDPHNI